MTTPSPANTANLPATDDHPLYLPSVPAREVFRLEGDLESCIVAELERDESQLADLLNLEINRVVTQRPNGNSLRPDVLINLSDDGREAEAVLEITLEPLDVDHLRRTVLYAIEYAAATGIIITPAVDATMLDLVHLYASSVNVDLTVLTLNTFPASGTGRSAFDLTPAFGGESNEDATMLELDLLRLVQKRLRELGHTSLDHVSVQRNRRIELNRDGARYRLYAGKRKATLTIRIGDKNDGTPALTTYHRLLRDSALIEEAVGEITWGTTDRDSGGTHITTRVAYGAPIQALDDAAFHQSATRIARVYIAFHAATIGYL